MIPKTETPLERVERDIARLKGLPDIMVYDMRRPGMASLGPWESVHEHSKHLLLGDLDWSGVSADDRRRIEEREVKPYDIFDCFRRDKDADW